MDIISGVLSIASSTSSTNQVSLGLGGNNNVLSLHFLIATSELANTLNMIQDLVSSIGSGTSLNHDLRRIQAVLSRITIVLQSVQLMITGPMDSAIVDALDNLVLSLTKSLRTIKKSLESSISRKSSRLKLMVRTIYDRNDLKELLGAFQHTLNEFSNFSLYLSHAAIRNLPSYSDMACESLGSFLQRATRLKLHRSEAQDFLTWLSPYDNEDRKDELLKSSVTDATKWILKDSTFREWSSPESTTKVESESSVSIKKVVRSDVLWCHGKPGSGKSVLMSTVIDFLITSVASDDSSVVAYFYFDYLTNKSPEEFLRSLVKQLCQASKHLPPSILRIQERWKAGEYDEGQQSIMYDVLAGFFDLTAQFNRTFVCLDALDECLDQHRHVLRDLLNRIMKSGCRLMASSRPGEFFKNLFQNCSSIEIRIETSNIDEYLRSAFDKHPKLEDMMDDNLKKLVIDTIRKTSCGLYLHAQLQLQHVLDQPSVFHIRQALKQLLKEDDEKDRTFDYILERCSQQSGTRYALARHVLTWLAFSCRQLTISELRYAVAIDRNSPDFSFDPERLSPIRLIDEVCKGFVLTDENRDTVQLKPSSLKYNLTQRRRDLFPHGSAAVAACCTRYLISADCSKGPCASQEELERRFKAFPLLNYVAHFWGEHIAEYFNCAAEKGSEIGAERDETKEIRTAVQRIFHNRLLLEALAQIMYASVPRLAWDAYPQGMPPLHFAAYFGFNMVSSALISLEHADVHSRDGWKRTALHIACERGHPRIVEQLLEQGAETDVIDNRHRTPLHYAAINGNVKIMRRLLQCDDVPIEFIDGRKRTALDYAAEGGHEKVVGLLLEEAGADPDFDDSLTIAAAGGYLLIVNKLLERGAMTQLGAALRKAVDQGFEDVVPALLSAGADVNDADDEGVTALHLAACTGRTSMAKFLLSSRANIDCVDHQGRTPLYLAAEAGDERTVRLLAGMGAAIDLYTKDGRTPLSSSAEKGNQEVVELLLKRGASVDSSGSFSSSTSHATVIPGVRTPLQMACYGGHESVARLLLDRGADVNGKGTLGRTPLSYAAETTNLKLLELLLDHFADVNLPDDTGMTPILRAVQMGDPEVIRKLLDAGADPNGPDPTGKTALSYAIQGSNRKVATLLAHHGAKLPEENDSSASTAELNDLLKGVPEESYELPLPVPEGNLEENKETTYQESWVLTPKLSSRHLLTSE